MSRIIDFFTGNRNKTNKLKGNDLLEALYYQMMQNRAVVFYNFKPEDYIKKGYQGNAEVYKIVRKIVDKCSFPETLVYTDDGVKSASKSLRIMKPTTKATTPEANAVGRLYRHKALEYVDDINNDLVRLVNTPNTYQSYKEMMELFRIFYFVQGEAFLYRETPLNSDIAVSLHVAPANLMTPIYSDDAENIISGWTLDMQNGIFRDLDAKDVLHLKMTNPNFTPDGKQLRGQSPLMAGLKYLQLDDKAIESWIKSVENEGAKGIVSPNHSDPRLWLTPSQVVDVQKTMETKIHGMDNKNKIAVSGMPLQYTQIGMSPESLALIEGLNHAQVNLADLWNVPAVLFDPNPTYENQKEARKAFVADTIIPYLEKEEQALNKWLVKPFSERDNKNYILDNDTSTYPELKLSRDDIDGLKSYLSYNEVRISQGYDEIENEYANELFVQQGMVPLSDFEVNINI